MNKKITLKNGKYIKHEEGHTIEEWFKNNLHHREDGPALICKRNDFVLFSEWYQNGKIHHENGPALIINYDSGLKEEKYYLNGIEYSEEKFENAKKTLYLNNELTQELAAKPEQKQKKLKV
jgi:hypothetical protein